MLDKTNRIIVVIEQVDDFDPFLDFSVAVEYEQQRLLTYGTNLGYAED